MSVKIGASLLSVLLTAPTAVAFACGDDAGTAESGETETETETTGSNLMRCSLANIAAGVPSPVVTGTGVGELPAEIGAVVENNCGCHLSTVDQHTVDVTPAPPAVVFRNWDEFHAPYGMGPLHQTIHTRVVTSAGTGAAMPFPVHCLPLEADEFDLFKRWLEADAPDAVDWAAMP